MHTNFRVLLAIHHQRRGHFDVRAVEVLQFLFPVVVFEREEQRPQHCWVVELGAEYMATSLGLTRGPGLAFSTRPPPGPNRIFAPAAIALEKRAGHFAFFRVELAVAVLVILLDNLALLAHRRTAFAERRRSERRLGKEHRDDDNESGGGGCVSMPH